MKKKYFYVVLLLSFFLCICKVDAVSANDYKVGKYVYYNPVTGNYCSSSNYWTYYNQRTSCYRWAIIDVDADKNKIRLLLDHDIGESTFDGRNTLYADAQKKWKKDNISGIGYLGHKMIFKLSKGKYYLSDNHKQKVKFDNLIKELNKLESLTINKMNVSYSYSNTGRYYKNPLWDKNNPTIYPYYKRISNYELEDYVVRTPITFIYNNVSKSSSKGYWIVLSDANSNELGSLRKNYALFVNKDGNLQLANVNEKKGVRPTIWLDIKALKGNTYDDYSRKVKSVIDTSKSELPIGTGENTVKLKENLAYFSQGFAVAGKNKFYFYLVPQGTITKNKLKTKLNQTRDPGVLLYYNSKKISQKTTGVYGHGNSMQYVKGKNSDYIYITSNPAGARDIVYLTLNKKGNITNEMTNTSIKSGTFSIKGKNLYTMSADRIINIYNYNNKNNDKKLTYRFESNDFDTIQDFVYLNGYLFSLSYGGCGVSHQLYCYSSNDEAFVRVYNVKMNPDGTPNRWFGHYVTSYKIDINKDPDVTLEAEGIDKYGNTIYLSFNKKIKSKSWTPAVYSYNQQFNEVTYKLNDNTSYIDKVIYNRFVDMGLYLDGKTPKNGFIGWQTVVDGDTKVYNNPDLHSLRIKAKTTLEGVYIEPTKNIYKFEDNRILKLTSKKTVGDLIKDIKCYNCKIRVIRNYSNVSNNEYIKNGDILKVDPDGELVDKETNEYSTKYRLKIN